MASILSDSTVHFSVGISVVFSLFFPIASAVSCLKVFCIAFTEEIKSDLQSPKTCTR